MHPNAHIRSLPPGHGRGHFAAGRASGRFAAGRARDYFVAQWALASFDAARQETTA